MTNLNRDKRPELCKTCKCHPGGICLVSTSYEETRPKAVLRKTGECSYYRRMAL